VDEMLAGAGQRSQRLRSARSGKPTLVSRAQIPASGMGRGLRLLGEEAVTVDDRGGEVDELAVIDA
jgi:hypothetical protein